MKTTNTGYSFADVMRFNLRLYGRQYLTWIGMMVGIMIGVVAWHYIQTFSYGFYDVDIEGSIKGMETSLLWMMLVLGSCFMGANMMSPLSDRASRIHWLLVPASAWSKILVRWIMVVPAFYILCFVGLELVELLRYIVVSLCFPGSYAAHFFGWEVISYDSFWELFSLISIITLQSFYVLGSVVWPKRGLLYTSLTLIAMSALFSMWTMLLLETFDCEKSSFGSADISTTTARCLPILFLSIVVAVNYVMAYFRYKEIEIIQRW